MIMRVLKDYEDQSGHNINLQKSFFMFNKAAQNHVQVVKEATDLTRGKFPSIYLGCPNGHAKKKKIISRG